MPATRARSGGGEELQLLNLWNALDVRRRIIVILASLAMFAAVLGLARITSQPSMSLLYSGLESSAAGDVVAALEARGVAYDVRGGAIMVDSARRDELRMTLAGEGLPANSARGYELLDNLSGFGTTSQMFNAAYWRAKEGELARTIVAHPAISSARVHIANAGSNPFQRDVSGSASVAVNTAAGGMTPAQARALQFLVASAVTGLSPEDVSVIDGNGELISAAEEAPANTTDQRAEDLRQKVTRLLEARVGPGNAVVEVSVETVTRSEMLRERVIDPESRTVISTDTEERSGTSQDNGGDVTVASNLPDGEAGGNSSNSQNNETRERINYEISETEREITLAPGAIKRLSVAVLVNGTTIVDAAGASRFEARSEQELTDLRDLVASAVGLDEARGDNLTLKTLEFEAPVAEGTEAQSSFIASLGLDIMSIVQAAILGIVALVLGLFVVRPVLAGGANDVPQLAPPPEDQGAVAGAAAATSAADTRGALTGEINPSDALGDGSDLQLVSGSDGLGDLPDLSLPDLDSLGGDLPALAMAGGVGASGDPVDRLRGLIDERRDETVEILRTWLEGEEEKV
ncbi:MAG: flagellar basal-body MS-ring/collar protein FliF [Pseudomonadota bacterium]